jgi:lysophospholipase L1-like esterase
VIQLRALASGLTLLPALLLAELPAALGAVDYGHVWSVASGEWNGPASGFVSDPLLGWSRPPHRAWSGRPRSDMAVAWNLSVRAPRVLSFTTDAQGFRNRGDLRRADVALVGDSFVEGAYVSDEETVAVELETLTGRRVANLGRSGYGTLQELEVVRAFALPLQPRVVVWFFFEGNDLYDDDAYENALAYLRQHGSYAPRGGGPVDWRALLEASFCANGWRLLRRALDPLVPVSAPSYGLFPAGNGDTVKLYFYQDAALRFDDYEERRFAKTQQALLAGAELLQRNGIALRLAFVPSKFRVYGGRCRYPAESPCSGWRVWDLEERFRAFCAREGLALVDLTGPMSAAAAAGRLLYAPEDSHWNAQGHRFVSELVAAALPAR